MYNTNNLPIRYRMRFIRMLILDRKTTRLADVIYTLYGVDNGFNRLAHEINILYTQSHAFCVVANQRRPQMDWPDLFSISSMIIKCVFRRIWRGSYTFFLDEKIPKISNTLWTYWTHPECYPDVSISLDIVKFSYRLLDSIVPKCIFLYPPNKWFW